MKFDFLTYLIITLSFFSCSNSEKKIFQIQKPEDIIKISNKIETSSIDKKNKLPLTFFEKTNKYYKYRKVSYPFNNKNFKAIIILGQNKTKELYNLLLRTINKKNKKIINTFLIASYNKNTNEFCEGYVTNNMILKRYCKSVNFTLEKQIDNFGNINFNKK